MKSAKEEAQEFAAKWSVASGEALICGDTDSIIEDLAKRIDLWRAEGWETRKRDIEQQHGVVFDVEIERGDGDTRTIARRMELPALPRVGERIVLDGPCFGRDDLGKHRDDESFFIVDRIVHRLGCVEVHVVHDDVRGDVPPWRPWCVCNDKDQNVVCGHCTNCNDPVRMGPQP